MEKQEHRRMEVLSVHEYIADRQIRYLWTRVGMAFENADGSWNLRLHALPVTNPKSGLAELRMRPPRPKETGSGNPENSADPADITGDLNSDEQDDTNYLPRKFDYPAYNSEAGIRG